MFVRWESQSVEADHEPRLPGVAEDVVVRRFDAPEALDIRFHEVRTKSAINRVPAISRVPFEWTVNPYRGCSHACSFCFARPTHEYLDLNAGRDFEREIIVKVNVPEVLRAELARPSWGGQHIALGTNTDPYQWVEGRYKLMRGIWEAMRDFANPCSILTKSPLLLRDMDLLMRDRRAHGGQRVPVGADAGGEGVAGDGAAHAAPARAARGGGGAQPHRDPDGHPDRAADAGDQRRAGAGASGSSSWRPRPAPSTSAARRCSCAARCGRSSSSGCASTGRTCSSATSACTRAGRTCPPTSGATIERAAGAPWARRQARAPAPRGAARGRAAREVTPQAAAVLKRPCTSACRVTSGTDAR